MRGSVARRLEHLEGLLAEPISAHPSCSKHSTVTRLETVVASPVSIIPKLIFAEAGNFPGWRFYLGTVVHRGIDLIAAILARGG